jgi:hypothetical protein
MLIDYLEAHTIAHRKTESFVHLKSAIWRQHENTFVGKLM